jgi:hypothetical protein
MLPYYSDIIYISEDTKIAIDSSKCGLILLPCYTLEYGRTKVATFEWD